MSLRQPAVLLATWFGTGMLPVAPGTWASLVALAMAWVVVGGLGVWVLAAGCLMLLFAGLWAAGRCARACGDSDPKVVVVDEVVGQWLVLLVVPPDPRLYAAGFLLFRLFDILKPWPVSWAERRFAGGLGIMADDVLAAAYAAALLWLLSRWLAVPA